MLANLPPDCKPLFDPLDIQTAVRYHIERMYAAGLSIHPLHVRQPSGLRHAGRWLLVALLLVLASVALARVALGGTAPADATVVVQPGETLWSIAAARYPTADTRERVDAIERLNGLSSPRIEVGEVLQLPAP